MFEEFLDKFTIEYINNIEKTINNNGCWIPLNRPHKNGYVLISLGKDRKVKQFWLHRVVMCRFNNISYDDSTIDTRHKAGCSHACFNPEHLKPGTRSDNIKDVVKDGNHNMASKINCPKCNGPYRTYVRKSGISKGRIYRICPSCDGARSRNWSRSKRNKDEPKLVR